VPKRTTGLVEVEVLLSLSEGFDLVRALDVFQALEVHCRRHVVNGLGDLAWYHCPGRCIGWFRASSNLAGSGLLCTLDVCFFCEILISFMLN